jgi:hypothetical protein
MEIFFFFARETPRVRMRILGCENGSWRQRRLPSSLAVVVVAVHRRNLLRTAVCRLSPCLLLGKLWGTTDPAETKKKKICAQAMKTDPRSHLGKFSMRGRVRR